MKLFWIILGALLLLCAACLGFILYVFMKSFRRNPEDADAATLRHYEEFDARGIDTRAMREGFCWAGTAPCEEWFLTSRDGLRLRARYYPAEVPCGRLAVLVHGYHSSGQNDFSGIFTFYHSRGFDILLPDQRTHGKSEGKYITFGARERYDIVDWVKLAVERKGPQSILLSGISMGCTTALLAAAEPDMPPLRYVTADCGYTCPFSIFGDVLKAWYHLPAFPFLPIADRVCGLIAGFRFADFDTREAVKHLSCLVTFVHGEADDFVNICNSRENFAACTAPQKELITVPGAGHGLSYVLDQPRIDDALERAIREYF